jgi:tripartite-type tricarboxylate transporter receptor subunit TctC
MGGGRGDESAIVAVTFLRIAPEASHRYARAPAVSRRTRIDMQESRRRVLAFLAAPLLLAARGALGVDYPARPVRIIVPAAPGGGDDFAARVLADQLSTQLGQQFVVENRPGAGGVIGQLAVAKAPPDGYMLLLAGGSMAGARFVNANATYDLAKDFTPVSTIEASPFVLVVSPSLPVRTLKEFIDHARERPGKLTYGTIGAGQVPYWAMLLLNSTAGIQAVEVPYKSGGDAVTDIISGRTDYYIAPLVTAAGMRDKLRILGVTSAGRSEMLPDVPSIAEAGLPGYEMPAWRSIMGPAGLPSEVVAVLHREIQKALASPLLRERFLKAGSTPLGGTPEELRKRYEDWSAIFGRIAKDTNLKPQ